MDDIPVSSLIRLLDKTIDETDVALATLRIAEDTKKEEKRSSSVVIFRLGNQWLALDTAILLEIFPLAKIHTIPHRTNEVFMGFVNFRGTLALCIDLQQLLGIPAQKAPFNCLVAIQKEEERWIFPVSEVFGVFDCNLSSLDPLPASLLCSPINCLRGIFGYDDKQVCYLDSSLLFYGLRNSLNIK